MADSTYNVRWTEDEDEAVKLHFPLHGSKWEGWKTLLPRRTDKAVSVRAHVLGVTLHPDVRAQVQKETARKRRAGRWTRDEEAIIADYFPRHRMDWEGWDELLPNRTKESIRAHAYVMGVIYRGNVTRIFTKAEKARLLKTVLQLSDAINATPYEVALELVELGKEWERQATA